MCVCVTKYDWKLAKKGVHKTVLMFCIICVYVCVQQETVEEEEEPLPAGWAMGTAPNGRQFFIDHNDRRTTWVSALYCDL